MTASSLRIAIVETLDAPLDAAANVAGALVTLQRAAEAGAELVLFPELSVSGYSCGSDMARRAAAAAGTLDRLQAAADQLGVSAVVGLPLFHGQFLFNDVAVLRPGRPAEHYAKTHLYPAEHGCFTPGDRFWTGAIAGWPCGILVCYEIGFPEIARALALAGAQLLLVPAAFGRARGRIWRTATVARALENGCFLAAAGQAGTNGALLFLGQSRVVDPFGRVIAGADAVDAADGGSRSADAAAEPAFELDTRGGRHTVWLADLDADSVAAARAGEDGWHRYFEDRRPELYAPLAERRDATSRG